MRLLPAAPAWDEFRRPPGTVSGAGLLNQLELLLVDWTFGTEELAGYSDILREVETAPVLCMHPGMPRNLD